MKHNQVAMLLTAFAGTSAYTEQRAFPSTLARLPSPTADPVELTRAAHRLLPQLEDGIRYAHAVIMLTGLRPAAVHQPLDDMFRHPHEDAGVADTHRSGAETHGPRFPRTGLARYAPRAHLDDEARDAIPAGNYALGRVMARTPPVDRATQSHTDTVR